MAMFNTLSLNVSYLVTDAGGSSLESGYVTSAFSLLAFLGGLVLPMLPDFSRDLLWPSD